MSDLDALEDLVRYLTRTSRLSPLEARHVADEVLSLLAGPPEDFAPRRTASGRSAGSSTVEPSRVSAARPGGPVSNVQARCVTCGIVGYSGRQDAGPILMEGQRRLEYRGYDSAGVAVVRSGALRIYESKGKVRDLERLVPQGLKGTPGIARTRWATHGEPNDRNAHPHADGANRYAVVYRSQLSACGGVPRLGTQARSARAHRS